ncbi:hypothetical protein H0H92_008181 [Tricholoma furcatifolium]|nr:hypothetical protein H0H92_008181 [Tricholoma furcatifolium]
MVSTFAPPPTINTLDHQQRMRLVLSNRKLEAVLGAAPFYIEPTSSVETHLMTPKAIRREGKLFNHSPTSSFASASSTSLSSVENFVTVDTIPRPVTPVKASSKQELSRPLLLRLRSVPVAPPNYRAALLSPRLPSIAPVSPISPTFTIDFEKLQATSLESRRKKMAKLTRTLGENIPPELVFPTNKPPKSRCLDSSPIPFSFAAGPSTVSSDILEKPLPTISRPKPMSRAQSKHSQPPPPASAPAPVFHITAPPPPPPPSSKNPTTIAERRRKPRPRSLSLSAATDLLAAKAAVALREEHKQKTEDVLVDKIVASVAETDITVRVGLEVYPAPQSFAIDNKATKDVYESHSPLPFQTVISDVPIPQPQSLRSTPTKTDFEFGPLKTQSTPQHVKSKSASSAPSKSKCPSGALLALRELGNGRRKEAGWSGEWNHEIGDVVKNLRNLKAR